ncbi:glycosyltransferase (plasmid) [Roseomonas marmotae]|nr:glycosyltransferase [Roseomonas marmotae]QTI81135.1 glycosyltransferase [Roseomonas marmotae]
MLLTRQLLRDLGFESEIFVEHPDAALAGELHPYLRHPGALAGPDELLLVHHSIGISPAVLAWLGAVTCPRVLVYHNITPSRFFASSPELARVLDLGRQQLSHWAVQEGMFSGCFANSTFSLDELREAGFGFGRQPMAVLPILADLDMLRQRARSLACPYPARGLKQEPLPQRLLFVGRLSPHKCQHDLIEALTRLTAYRAAPLHLDLVGGGDADYRALLERAARQAGVADHVHLHGKISDEALAGIYARADAFVCLSEHEGFCIPLLEASLHRIPVLAYDAGAVRETLGQGGLILQSKDPDTVSAAISAVLDEPLLRRRIVEAQWRNLARFERPQLLRGLADFLGQLGHGIALPEPEPVPVPRPGYRIEGPITSSYSLAIVNRELGLALTRAGEPVAFRSTEGGSGDFPPAPEELVALPDVAARMVEASDIAGDDTSVVLRNLYPPYVEGIRPAGLRGLACYAWEESGFPRFHAEAFNRNLDLITVTSAHVAKVLRDAGVHLPVRVVGNGTDHLQRGAAPDLAAAEALLAGRAPGFRFLHVSSALPRKGVDVLLKAWAEFSAGTGRDASLVIKTSPGVPHQIRQQLEELQACQPALRPVVLIEEDLPTATLRGLFAICDAFVAPARAEGFGLPLAEAMLARRPVITTGWGGQLSFCTPATAWLVDYRLVAARSHLGVFNSAWAEPSLPHLVACMREVAGAAPEDLAPRLGAAEALLKRDFTWDRVAQRVRAAVEEVEAEDSMSLMPPSVAMATSWNNRCGIAAYAKSFASGIPASRLTVLANTDATLLGPDEEFVQRVWRTGRQDDLQALEDAMAPHDVAVFQFNFGFFRLDALGRILRRRALEKKRSYVVLHSTADVLRPDMRISLAEIAEDLACATRLLVHGIEDLERLRGFGLTENVQLFPHGAPEAPAAPGTATPPAWPGLEGRRVIATFGYLLPHKGLREMIQAMPALLRQCAAAGLPAPHLLMVNALYPAEVSAAEHEACKALIAELGLCDDITLLPDYREEAEILRLLGMADRIVYAYQSTQESSSAAVRMGLASGRPVAVTPLSIFDDVMDVTYRLPGTDPDSLAAGLLASWGERREEIDAIAATQARWIGAHRWQQVSRHAWDLMRAPR